MTSEAKKSYCSKHVHALAKKYNTKVDIYKDSSSSEQDIKLAWSNITKKQLDKYIGTIEHGMALMPDSFLVVTESDEVVQNKVFAQQKIDTKTIILTNKNKIRYVRMHKIADSNIIIIEK